MRWRVRVHKMERSNVTAALEATKSQEAKEWTRPDRRPRGVRVLKKRRRHLVEERCDAAGRGLWYEVTQVGIVELIKLWTRSSTRQAWSVYT